jgi:ectoine hydroxylase-related dioxygenase (phytanoyl-CoA dioxygenase family)
MVMIDADVRFAALLDHPAVEPYLVAFLGEDYRHIDNDMYFVVPGSHKSRFAIDTERVDLPGQHSFNNVEAGDVIVFNEALLHNGWPNPSDKIRITLIVNFGRADAGPWPGYRPKSETLTAVTPRQRQILTPSSPVWHEPALT